MHIDATILIPVAAVVASALLFMAGRKRVLEVIALVASAIWLAVSLGVMKWPLDHRLASLGMVIGGTLLVTGVAVYLRTHNKREVTASTVLAILGGTLVVGALAVLG